MNQKQFSFEKFSSFSMKTCKLLGKKRNGKVTTTTTINFETEKRANKDITLWGKIKLSD